MNLPETVKLQEIYGETEVSGARFKNLADHYQPVSEGIKKAWQ